MRIAEQGVVLIRPSQMHEDDMGPDELYEITRGDWRIDPRRDPQWAFCVVGGVVRACYRISGWHKADLAGRWTFDGEPDPGMEARYVGKDVRDHLKRGNANPVTYVNCPRPRRTARP